MRLISTCAAALAGIAIGVVQHLSAAPLVLGTSLAALALACVWRAPRWRMVALVALAASLGTMRASLPLAVPVFDLPAIEENLIALRASARASLSHYLPEPQASVAAGVLLGGSGQLSASFKLDLQRSGLSHIVAIDGFKQVVVASTLGSVVARLLGARAALLTGLVGITGYTLLTGGHPSAIRAALMVGLASFAALSGRLPDPLTSLALAALAMALLDPRVLLDLGLQLSLSASLGLVLLWPTLRRWLHLQRLPCMLAEPLGLSVAVTLACFPVTLSTFAQVSLVSPIAHILAVPLLSLVWLGSALLVLLGALPQPLASLAAWTAWLPTSLLAAVVHIFGSLPGAAVSTGRLPVPAATTLAAALLAGGAWHLPELGGVRRQWTRWWLRHTPLLAPAGVCATCAGLSSLLVLLLPDGRQHVLPLDVSGGQAVFIRHPSGSTTLVVHGRPDARTLQNQVADHLNVWEHKLNEVVVSDAAASSAVKLTLSRYPADRVVSVSATQPRSAPTTSAARPGSAN